MIKTSKFLLVIIAMIILLAFILMFQPFRSSVITESLPVDKTSFGYGCIPVSNLAFLDSEGVDVIVNQENGNKCGIVRKNSDFSSARGPRNSSIDVGFIATNVEQNCDGLINNYSSFVVSKDNKVYQCLQDAPI